MKTTARRIVRGEKGKVLILALVLLGVGGLLMAPTLGLMSTGLSAGQIYEKKTGEFYSADAGVEDAINWLLHGRPSDWPWTGDDAGPWQRDTLLINHAAVNVTIAVQGSPDDHTYMVTSTASRAGGGTTVISIVKAQPRFQGCYLTGEQTLGNQSGPLTGTVVVVGDVKIEHLYTMNSEEVFIDGNLHLVNNSELNADVICLTGNITMGNRTRINADIHFLGANNKITIDQPQSYITGNIWAEGDLTIRIMLGSAPVEIECPDGVYAEGDVYVLLDKLNSKLVGDIYSAGPTIEVTGPGTHAGETYSNHTGDDPFEIPPCPILPDPKGVVVDTYEVLGYGG